MRGAVEEREGSDREERVAGGARRRTFAAPPHTPRGDLRHACTLPDQGRGDPCARRQAEAQPEHDAPPRRVADSAVRPHQRRSDPDLAERPPVNPIVRRPRREHPVRRPHELDLRARLHAETDIFSVRGDLPDEQLSPYAQPDPSDATTRLQRDAPRPQRRVDARAMEVARRRTIALRGRRVEHVTDAHVRRATQQRAHHRQGVHRDPRPRSDRAGRWRRRRRLAWRKRAPEGRRGPHGQRREGRRDAPRARRHADECDRPHDVKRTRTPTRRDVRASRSFSLPAHEPAPTLAQTPSMRW